jgi:hypothetical protein
MRECVSQYRRKAVENISQAFSTPLWAALFLPWRQIIVHLIFAIGFLTTGPRQTMLHLTLEDFVSVFCSRFGALVRGRKAQKG